MDYADDSKRERSRGGDTERDYYPYTTFIKNPIVVRNTFSKDGIEEEKKEKKKEKKEKEHNHPVSQKKDGICPCPSQTMQSQPQQQKPQQQQQRAHQSECQRYTQPKELQRQCHWSESPYPQQPKELPRQCHWSESPYPQQPNCHRRQPQSQPNRLPCCQRTNCLSTGYNNTTYPPRIVPAHLKVSPEERTVNHSPKTHAITEAKTEATATASSSAKKQAKARKPIRSTYGNSYHYSIPFRNILTTPRIGVGSPNKFVIHKYNPTTTSPRKSLNKQTNDKTVKKCGCCVQNSNETLMEEPISSYRFVCMENCDTSQCSNQKQEQNDNVVGGESETDTKEKNMVCACPQKKKSTKQKTNQQKTCCKKNYNLDKRTLSALCKYIQNLAQNCQHSTEFPSPCPPPAPPPSCYCGAKKKPKAKKPTQPPGGPRSCACRKKSLPPISPPCHCGQRQMSAAASKRKPKAKPNSKPKPQLVLRGCHVIEKGRGQLVVTCDAYSSSSRNSRCSGGTGRPLPYPSLNTSISSMRPRCLPLGHIHSYNHVRHIKKPNCATDLRFKAKRMIPFYISKKNTIRDSALRIYIDDDDDEKPCSSNKQWKKCTKNSVTYEQNEHEDVSGELDTTTV